MTTNATIKPDSRYRSRVAVLSLAMLLPSLGTSIANVALPTLATSFAARFEDVQWVVVAYLMSVTTLIVGAGRLGDLIGHRRLLLIGIAIFGSASVICMAAQHLWVLVLARAIQGGGAAIMMSLTVASVGDLVPKDRTGSAIGFLGTVSALGTALGPSLGGALISWSGWPAVFGFMGILSLLTLVVGFRAIPVDAVEGKTPFTFDVPGMLALAFTLCTFALSATLGGGNFGSVNLALVGASAFGLVAFVLIELRSAAPLVELGLLRNAAFSAPLVNMALVSSIIMATLVVGPFYLSDVLHLTSVHTGLVMSVGPGVAALAGFPAGRLVDRFGPNRVLAAGIVGVFVGSALMIQLPRTFGVGGYVLSLAVITAGYALFQAANNTAAMNQAAKNQRGVISALLGLARNLGLISGASAMGAIYAWGSRGTTLFGTGSGGEAGLILTFTVAAVFASLSLAIALQGFRQATSQTQIMGSKWRR
jgi:MFS family permease